MAELTAVLNPCARLRERGCSGLLNVPQKYRGGARSNSSQHQTSKGKRAHFL